MSSNVLKIPVISRLRSTGGIADIFNTRWNIFLYLSKIKEIFFLLFLSMRNNAKTHQNLSPPPHPQSFLVTFGLNIFISSIHSHYSFSAYRQHN